MPTLRLVRSRDLVRVPWKNGGGTTAEVAVHPPGSAFDDFDWRISMADVAGDGPFSRFPGIDRTLVLAQGCDLTLTIDGQSHRLAEPGDLLGFSGEAETLGSLGRGPVRDINIMSRRGRFSHRVTRLSAGAAPSDGTRQDLVAVVALQALAAIVHGSLWRLEPLDVALIDVALIEGGVRDLSVDGPAILVELRSGAV